MSYFLHQCLNGLSLGAIYSLVALGFAMVYGVMKFLNFAHSEVFTTGAFAGYFSLKALLTPLTRKPELAVVLSIFIASMGAGCMGLILERVAYRPLRDKPRVTALLTAIGLSLLLQNIGIALFSAASRGYPAVILPAPPRLLAVILLLLSFFILMWLIHYTNIGIGMRAVSEDAEAAALMGLEASRIIAFAFFVGGFFAGIAGITWGLVYGVINPQMGFYIGLKAFIIAVVGGIGSLPGTFLMGLVLGFGETMLTAYLPSQLSGLHDTFFFALLLLLLRIKPNGIFGKPQVEKV